MERINKILLICLANIDDAVLMTSLISPLLKTYPHAKIEVLAKPEFETLFRENPLIENVISWRNEKTVGNQSPKTFVKRLSTFLSIANQLKKGHFELVIDCRKTWLSDFMTKICFPESYLVIYRRHIICKLQEETIKLNQRVDIRTQSTLYTIAELIAKNHSQLKILLPQSDKTKDQVRQILKRHHLGSYIALCPFNNCDVNHSVNYWRSLITQINIETNFPVVIIGSAQHQVMAEMIADDLPNVVNLVAETTLLQNVCIARMAEAVAGVDRLLLPIAENLGLHVLTPDPLANMDVYQQLNNIPNRYAFLTKPITEKQRLAQTVAEASAGKIENERGQKNTPESNSIKEIVRKLEFTHKPAINEQG